MMEGDKDIPSEGVKFIDLVKQYPHSDIKTKTQHGKITKYEVKEKIKLDSE